MLRRTLTALAITAAPLYAPAITSTPPAAFGDSAWGSPATGNDSAWGTPPTEPAPEPTDPPATGDDSAWG